MSTLEFAQRHVVFNETSPITGRFNIEAYPFLRTPMEAADNIRVKRLVIYKSSSSMGTVLGQILTAKRIVCDAGNQLYFCQTDDDATTWSKTRGKEFLRSIPDAMRLLSRDKYAITNSLWLFRHKFLEILGPGINSVQSRQVRFVQTDESHLDTYEPGRLIELEKRMGGRWDRQAVHITTAPDEGKEVDTFFNEGQQDEWHFRCPKCAKLVWPIWSRELCENTYNGELVFLAAEGVVNFKCPHCDLIATDFSRNRYELVKHGDYVAQNRDAPIATRSFRWNVFAAHWISWRELLAEHTAAMEAAKLGNLKPLEDWTKKRECRTWTPTIPDFGEGRGANDYAVGDEWMVEDSIKIISFDFQAGKGSEGAHLWALVTQWTRSGDSRRLDYRKVETFAQLEAIQLEFGVPSKQVAGDSGHENRLVFRECGKRQWFATRGSDATEILHTVQRGNSRLVFPMPYSQTEPQSGVVGEKQPEKLRGVRIGKLPFGWAYCIVIANPTLYGYLSALISGKAGRYFGVAKDFPDEYVKNMPAFIAAKEKDKRTNREKVTWRKVRDDHPWDAEVISLMMAMRCGYYPLAKSEPEPQHYDPD